MELSGSTASVVRVCCTGESNNFPRRGKWRWRESNPRARTFGELPRTKPPPQSVRIPVEAPTSAGILALPIAAWYHM